MDSSALSRHRLAISDWRLELRFVKLALPLQGAALNVGLTDRFLIEKPMRGEFLPIETNTNSGHIRSNS